MVCSNEAEIVQLCRANNVACCWKKILSELERTPTLSNIMQQQHSVGQAFGLVKRG
jgi:pantoate kinase